MSRSKLNKCLQDLRDNKYVILASEIWDSALPIQPAVPCLKDPTTDVTLSPEVSVVLRIGRANQEGTNMYTTDVALKTDPVTGVWKQDDRRPNCVWVDEMKRETILTALQDIVDQANSKSIAQGENLLRHHFHWEYEGMR